MTENRTQLIYPNVTIDASTEIGDFVVLGKPPRGKKEGELALEIGRDGVIRPFSTLYAGTKIGNEFQCGQGASIREDNIIGNNVSIGTNAVLEFGNRIGNNVRIHSLCFLEMVTVEDDVFIGPNVVFTDDPHPMKCPKYLDCLGGVTIKKCAKIGANSTFLPGVTVGENALVGAGSVVTKDVPDNMVVAGSPAKVIKSVDDLECYPGFFEKPYTWPPYKK
jgi:acetyltransferase-like isoleucine patch superfamily enzyme